MSEGTNMVVKLFLFAVLFVGAVSAITITYNIINSSIPDVLGNCVERGPELIHISDIRIVSSEGAKRVLEPLINETPVFAGNIIELCGVGYVFKAGADKYIVCEDGSISKYVTVCKDDSIMDKGAGYIETLKEGVSASE